MYKCKNSLIKTNTRLKVEIGWIKAKLEKAEKSEFTNDSKDEILKEAKSY